MAGQQIFVVLSFIDIFRFKRKIVHLTITKTYFPNGCIRSIHFRLAEISFIFSLPYEGSNTQTYHRTHVQRKIISPIRKPKKIEFTIEHMCRERQFPPTENQRRLNLCFCRVILFVFPTLKPIMFYVTYTQK